MRIIADAIILIFLFAVFFVSHLDVPFAAKRLRSKIQWKRPRIMMRRKTRTPKR